MSKAEKFIIEHTSALKESNCKEYFKWLTPDQAREAVKIARNEAIEQTADWLTKHAIKYYINSKGFLGTEELVKDYKLIMAMKDE